MRSASSCSSAEVERNIAGLDRIAQAAASLRSMSSGTLRIAATPAITHGLLPRVVAAFLQEHPGVFVELRYGSRRFVIDSVASQTFDLAIEVPPINEPFVSEHFLTRQEAVCVLHEDHPLARKTVVKASDFVGQAFIAPMSGSMFRFQIDQLFLANHVDVKIRVETETQKSICDMVARGVGLGIVGPHVIEDSRGWPLVFRKLRPVISLAYSVLLPARRPQSLITRSFLTILEAQVDTEVEAQGRRPAKRVG
jgi:DNA-binding transcriptional LysR family regulator